MNLWLRAVLETNRARYERARAYALECARLFEAVGHEVHLIWPYQILGDISLRTGDYDQARSIFTEALRLTLENGDTRNGAEYAFLCETELRQGNLRQSFRYCKDYIILAHKYGTKFNVLDRLEMAAKIFARSGRYPEAARLSGAAEALSETYGRPTSAKSSEVSFPGDWRIRYADAALDALVPDWRTRPDGESIVQAWNAGRAMTYDQAVAYALGDVVV